MLKSNRAVGISFEQEFCNLLSTYGFWVKNLTQDKAGQPADVIAVKNSIAYLIDCKDCSAKGFDLRRVEENQITAMHLWNVCGNGHGWFAIKVEGEIYMLPYGYAMYFKGLQSKMSFEEIYENAEPFEKWVKQCK